MANLSNFVGALKDGGVRANQFEVNITSAPLGVLGQFDAGDFRFLCKGASIPALTVADISVPYSGLQLHVAGDRTYAAWSITVINDRDQRLRSGFEIWQNFMSDIGVVSNGGAGAGASPSAYYGKATVMQKDRNDNTLRSYHLYDIWPQNLGEVALSYDTENAVSEFTCDFVFNYMTISGAGTGPSDAQASFSATINIPIGG